MIKLMDILSEGKLTEKKQGYVVADIYGGVYTKKAVSEKKALAMLNKMSHFGGDKIFMIGVEAWNKPHKLNKKKEMVKEGISVADTRFVGKFVIHILSSGSEMRSAILSKKNNSKYGTRDKKDLKTLWDLAGKYKGKEIKEGKLNEGSKVVRLPNGVKVKIDFNGLTFIGGTKPVFLDRKEMEIFFKATAKYLK